ncbi:hypothetical protein BB560_003497 [Smittium megazygosporum]|uniref:Uncharacterized protein n=1 Tax=Smittium megazygosporum TaxID=133381 RepID=A0A2T9ZBY1_9FUNG|nr:hypothetical protein BB560_003497 [Smittium megazygosporum]
MNTPEPPFNEVEKRNFETQENQPFTQYEFYTQTRFTFNQDPRNALNYEFFNHQSNTVFGDSFMRNEFLVQKPSQSKNTSEFEKTKTNFKYRRYSLYNQPLSRQLDPKDNYLSAFQKHGIFDHLQTSFSSSSKNPSKIVKFSSASRRKTYSRGNKSILSRPRSFSLSSKNHAKVSTVYKRRNQNDSLASVLQKWKTGHQEERMQITKMGKSNKFELHEMINSGINISITDEVHRTALHVACSVGNLEAVDILLKMGANPNATDILGNTPLILAAISGHTDIVLLLLRHGANPKEGSKNISPSAMIRLRLKQLRAQIRKNRELMRSYSPSTLVHKGSKLKAARNDAYMVSRECRSILRILRYYTFNSNSQKPVSFDSATRSIIQTGEYDSDDFISDNEFESSDSSLSVDIKDAFEDITHHLRGLSVSGKSNKSQSTSLNSALIPGNTSYAPPSRFSKVNRIFKVYEESSITSLEDEWTSDEKDIASDNIHKGAFEQLSVDDTNSQNTNTGNEFENDTSTHEVELVLDKLGSLIDKLNIN